MADHDACLPTTRCKGKCRVTIHSMLASYGGAIGIPAEHGTYRSNALSFSTDEVHFRNMTNTPSLSALLDDCRATTHDWTPVYDAFVAKLREGSVAAAAPRVGEQFADFALPDERGRYRSLAEIVSERPVVLSFNRGGWCPFCRSELSAWGERSEELLAAGGKFVTITGEVGGRAVHLHELIGPGATILCDIDHGLALALGLAFRCGHDLRQRYLACGLDLADIYGGDGWFLPVPATFVIDRDLTVRYAFVDPDFRIRAEPDEVIEQVALLR